MKSEEENTPETTKPLVPNLEPAKGKRGTGLILKVDYHDARIESWPRPSELELATLAARLARTEKIDPKQLVDEAWKLYWESCRKVKADHTAVQNQMLEWEARDDGELDEVVVPPQPKHYPVTFEEMERLLLPKLKGRTANRASLFREYIFAQELGRCFVLRGEPRRVSYWEFEPEDLDQMREKLRDLVTRRFAELRKKQYDPQAYGDFAASFLPWHRKWMERKKSEVKAANAKKGWEKRAKAKQAKTGARPRMEVLQEIFDPPPKGA